MFRSLSLKSKHEATLDSAIEVAGPVLSHSERLDDPILVESAMTKSQDHLLAISRRKALAEPVTDVLVEKLGASLPALIRIGLPDAFPHKYGLQEELFEVYGLAPSQIAARVSKSLKKKDKVA